MACFSCDTGDLRSSRLHRSPHFFLSFLRHPEFAHARLEVTSWSRNRVQHMEKWKGKKLAEWSWFWHVLLVALFWVWSPVVRPVYLLSFLGCGSESATFTITGPLPRNTPAPHCYPQPTPPPSPTRIKRTWGLTVTQPFLLCEPVCLLAKTPPVGT